MTRILPALHGFSIRKKPVFATLQQITRAGREVTSAQQPLPLWEFDLTYEILRDSTQNIEPLSWLNGFDEYRDILIEFLIAGGQFGFFYFEDLSDNSRVQQAIGEGDGSTTEFLLLRTITFGSLTYTEPVGGINLDHSVVVYVDGTEVAQPGNWNISSDGRYLVFDVAPILGSVVQISFYYYYLCRFISDETDFEEFMSGRWSNRSLRFRSVNITPLADIPDWLPLTPPPVPDPPGTSSPVIGNRSQGRTGVFESNPTSVSLVNIGFGFLSTSTPGELIVVFISCEKSGVTAAREVTSVTSTSGLVFTRQGAGSYVNTTDAPSSRFNLEIWTATASTVLSNEIITANFDSAVGVASIIALAIQGARNATPIDSGVNPPPFDDSDVVGIGPSITFSTTNAFDLLLFVMIGVGPGNNNSAPAGGWSGAFPEWNVNSFFDSHILGINGYQLAVGATQTGVTVSGQDPGLGVFVGIRS